MENDPIHTGHQLPYEFYQPKPEILPSPTGYSSSPSAPTDPYPYPYPAYAPPPPPKSHRSLIKKILIGCGCVAIVAAIVAALVVVNIPKLLHSPVKSTPTFPPTPIVADAYSGSVHNSTFNEDAYMVMTSVTLYNGAINGNIQFGLPLIGSGPFAGTVSRSNFVTFVVNSDDNKGLNLTFSGTIEPVGFMSGTYRVNTGQSGTWRADPATAPILYPLLYHKYAGTYTNNSAHKSGSMTLQIITQNQQNLTGVYDGSLPFDGTVGSDNSIRFTITDAKGIAITFGGQVTIDGSLNGTFSTASSGVIGTWKVTPVQ